MNIPSGRPFILIGMPGAGKTYWAQRLAAAWGGAALDLDAEIARISGTSIPEIFASQGEAGFRKWEREVLQAVLISGKTDFLATGGGTPCHGNNLAQMQAAGTVIYLQAPVAVLARRILSDGDTRPLLAGCSETELLQKLASTLVAREPFYQQAHHTLAVEGLSETTFAAL